MRLMQYKITYFLIRRLIKDARALKRRAAKRAARRASGAMSQAARLLVASESFPQTFIIESFFCRELIAMLTRDGDEDMHFLTGPKLGPIRIISRCAHRPSLEEQSPVFVRATAKSVADVLISIIEQGAELHVIAHSHPGRGAGATTPSGTDTACLGKLQRNGSQVIGCIVTRDNYVRFFSVSTNFHVMVLGTGVKEVSKNVFRIALENSH